MPRCAGCKNTISGRYVQALGKDWHPGCFRCDECGKRLDEGFHVHAGRKLCAACFGELHAPRCAACGKPVLGRYVTAMGAAWHPECLTCSLCGKALGGEKFHEHQGKFVCASCYEKTYALRCDVCGATLTGHYKEDVWGNRFCPRHEKEPGLCELCGRIMGEKTTGGTVRYEDDREVCAICAGEGINDAGLVESFAAIVHRFFEKRGLGLSNSAWDTTLRYELVDRYGMPSDRHGEDRFGVIVRKIRTQGGQEVERSVEKVYLLSGMPPDRLCETIAHEYGHAWLFFHDFPQLPMRTEEGLAQLFAHMWLSERGTVTSAMLKKMAEESPDPAYGEGLRMALGAQERMGLAELFSSVKRNRRLP